MIEAWMQYRRNNTQKLTDPLTSDALPNYADEGEEDEDDDDEDDDDVREQAGRKHIVNFDTDDEEDDEHGAKEGLKNRSTNRPSTTVTTALNSDVDTFMPQARHPVPLNCSAFLHSR